MATIQQLKQRGHDLIDEYLQLIDKNSNTHTREKVYAQMEEIMHGKTPHFGNMRTKEEIMNAIGTLKKMIARKKYETQNI